MTSMLILLVYILSKKPFFLVFFALNLKAVLNILHPNLCKYSSTIETIKYLFNTKKKISILHVLIIQLILIYE